MLLEEQYTLKTNKEKIKKLGQYFTPAPIADFMAKWVSKNAKNVLDPAVGNGIFFKYIKKYNQECLLYGYEIDKEILEFFYNQHFNEVNNIDYLFSNWESKYDAIICNPPYNRFQTIDNRNLIRNTFLKNTDINISGYTNQYILFLIKSIFQMNNFARLAYIIPSEFLNSLYGKEVKKLLLEKKLLRAIINFKNNKDIFSNATTTSCIILLDKIEKTEVEFVLIENINEICGLTVEKTRLTNNSIMVNYQKLYKSEKWLSFLNNEKEIEITYNNLIPLKNICKVTRGIATGNNEYFLFSKSMIQALEIPESYFSLCTCKASDIKNPIFDEYELIKLINNDKKIYLLNIYDIDNEKVVEYIKHGENIGVDKKYLPSHRMPWYSMEQKQPSPIWITTASREKIKVIRNISNILNLTTFHSIFLTNSFEYYVDILFCYLLTPIAQNILKTNRKELGNGLDKFQPNDLNNTMVLNLALLGNSDKSKINSIYSDMKSHYNKQQINDLNKIFIKYLS